MIAKSTIAQGSARSLGPRELMPRPATVRRPPAARVALLHGGFLVAGAIAALARRRLSRGAGIGLAAGAALLASGARGKVARELRLLGAGAGITVAAANLMARKHELLAVAQLAFVALWIAAEVKETMAERRPPEPAFA
jgi:hypothetical protein